LRAATQGGDDEDDDYAGRAGVTGLDDDELAEKLRQDALEVRTTLLLLHVSCHT
jgi:hypothetical protein